MKKLDYNQASVPTTETNTAEVEASNIDTVGAISTQTTVNFEHSKSELFSAIEENIAFLIIVGTNEEKQTQPLSAESRKVGYSAGSAVRS